MTQRDRIGSDNRRSDHVRRGARGGRRVRRAPRISARRRRLAGTRRSGRCAGDPETRRLPRCRDPSPMSSAPGPTPSRLPWTRHAAWVTASSMPNDRSSAKPERVAGSMPRGWRSLARHHADALCVVSGGETTVRVTGCGTGGRNQEFALAAVPGLATVGRAAALASIGTDGVDGPTDAAGAIADSTSATRARGFGGSTRCGILKPTTRGHFSIAWGTSWSRARRTRTSATCRWRSSARPVVDLPSDRDTRRRSSGKVGRGT